MLVQASGKKDSTNILVCKQSPAHAGDDRDVNCGGNVGVAVAWDDSNGGPARCLLVKLSDIPDIPVSPLPVSQWSHLSLHAGAESKAEARHSVLAMLLPCSLL